MWMFVWSAAMAGDPAAAICKAVLAGDAKGVATAHAAGADPNGTCEVNQRAYDLGDAIMAFVPGLNIAAAVGGWYGHDTKVDLPLVQIALHNGRTSVLEALLAAGAKHPPLDQVLSEAATHRDATILDPLLSRGADLSTARLPTMQLDDTWAILPDLLKRGLPIDAEGSFDDTLLTAQGKEGCVPCVERLLALGANPKRPGDLAKIVERPGNNPEGWRASVRLLLDAGADPNAEGVLFEASGSGDVRMVKMLLEAGADPNGSPQKRPVYEASGYNGSTAILSTLESAGATLAPPGEPQGIDEALRAKNRDTYKWWQKRGFSPSSISGTGDVSDLAFLAEFGLLQHTDDHGRTLLHQAVKGFYAEETVPWLLKKGLSPNVTSRDGTTPIQLVDDVGVAKILLAAGAQLDAPGPVPALHHAAAQYRPDLLDLFLRKRPSLELLDEKGNTALATALLSRNKENALRLVRAGASTDIVDINGNSALSITMITHDGTTREALIAAGVAPTGAEWFAALSDRPVLEFLASSGARLDVRNASAETPLGAAIRAERWDAAEFMLRHGASSEDVDQAGHGAIELLILQSASTGYWTSNFTAAQRLVAAGANADIPSRSGVTPLLALLAIPAEPGLEMSHRSGVPPNEPGSEWVDWLLASGAAPGRVLPSGETPMELAIHSGRLNSVRSLVRVGVALPSRARLDRSDTLVLGAFLTDNGVRVDWTPGWAPLIAYSDVTFGQANAPLRLLQALVSQADFIPFEPLEFAIRQRRPEALKALVTKHPLSASEYKALKALSKNVQQWPSVRRALKAARE